MHTLSLSLAQLREHYRPLLELFEIVRPWKGTRFSLAGVRLSTTEVTDVGRILECAERCSKEAYPPDYCTQGPDTPSWGCLRLRPVEPYPTAYIMRFGTRRCWYQFGAFDPENRWRVDKSALRETLLRQARLDRLQLCPRFSLGEIEKRLSVVPEVIDPTGSDKWEIIYEEDLSGGLQQRRPQRIVPTRERHEVMATMDLPIPEVFGSRDDEDRSDDARDVPEVTFDHIGGIDAILREVREVVELPLVAPDLLERLGIIPHRGILLSGPPGCGKTLIAKAVAHETGAHFINIRGPEFLSKWYGESEQNLRRVFEEARRKEPSVIYFDEIDSIGAARTGDDVGRIDAKIVNQLLTIMDGFNDRGKVVVIGSTNRPDILDVALLRPGRFDYHLVVPMPDEAGCAAILTIHSARMPLSPSFRSADFSKRLVGLTGADIQFLCREAAYNCLRRTVDTLAVIRREEQTGDPSLLVSGEDFEEALAKITQQRRPGRMES